MRKRRSKLIAYFLSLSRTKIGSLLQKEEQANNLQQQALLNRYTGAQMERHLVKGDPTIVIPDFVNEHQIDVLIMGTVARSGIPGLLIGNTSETILHKVTTSVLTLKPCDFETIVT